MCIRDRYSGESESRAFVDLHLGDTGNFVFDGVFHRDDFAGAVNDFGQPRVESGRFARARGAGDENEAIAAPQVFLVEIYDCLLYTSRCV